MDLHGHSPHPGSGCRGTRTAARAALWLAGTDPVGVPGRPRGNHPVRYFPDAIRVLDSYASVHQVAVAFASEGFATVTLERVPQIAALSLHDAAAALRREAHTPLQLITDEEYDTGVDRLRQAALTQTGPVIDALDLLVLRREGSSARG